MSGILSRSELSTHICSILYNFFTSRKNRMSNENELNELELAKIIRDAIVYDDGNDSLVVTEDPQVWMYAVKKLTDLLIEQSHAPLIRNPKLQQALDEMTIDEMIPVEKDMHCNLTIAMQVIEYLLKQLKGK